MNAFSYLLFIWVNVAAGLPYSVQVLAYDTATALYPYTLVIIE